MRYAQIFSIIYSQAYVYIRSSIFSCYLFPSFLLERKLGGVFSTANILTVKYFCNMPLINI